MGKTIIIFHPFTRKEGAPIYWAPFFIVSTGLLFIYIALLLKPHKT